MPLDRASRITQMCKKDAKKIVVKSLTSVIRSFFVVVFFFPESELSPQILRANN